MLSLKKVNLSEVTDAYCSYSSSLRLVDTFWDDMILEAEIYGIYKADTLVGYTSYHKKDELLSSFILYDTTLLQKAFSLITETLSPKGARIVSSDETFIAAAIDHTGSFIPRAFFFDLTENEVRPAEYPHEWFYEAKEDDLPDLDKTGFYHPAEIGNEENRIFVMRDENGAFMGTGHIARSPFDRTWGAVGMYTAPEYRKKGVGRSMILFLTDITKEMGLTPICGCAYQNIASKSTLESCGYASKTRYIDFIF